MPLFFQFIGKKEGNIMKGDISPHIEAVSYTHLTLPTIA